MKRLLIAGVVMLGLAAVPAVVSADDGHRGRHHHGHHHGGHGNHHHGHHHHGHHHGHHHHVHRPYGYPVYRPFGPVRIQPQPFPVYRYDFPTRSNFYYGDRNFSIGIGF